jgi:hypothetical protein
MRWLAMLVTTLAFVSCDTNHDSPMKAGAVFAPVSTAGVNIAPSTLTFLPASLTCAAGPVVSTALALTVVPPDAQRSNVDQVTFRLIDGSNLGGPMVTVPHIELDRRFGSTVLLGPRTFEFQPLFDCGFAARFLTAAVVISTDRGATTTVNARAAIR